MPSACNGNEAAEGSTFRRPVQSVQPMRLLQQFQRAGGVGKYFLCIVLCGSIEGQLTDGNMDFSVVRQNPGSLCNGGVPATKPIPGSRVVLSNRARIYLYNTKKTGFIQCYLSLIAHYICHVLKGNINRFIEFTKSVLSLLCKTQSGPLPVGAHLALVPPGLKARDLPQTKKARWAVWRIS